MNEEQGQGTAQGSGETLGHWAIVELFGHTRIAGFVSEYQVGGSAFVRVEVPAFLAEGQETAGFTKLFGAGAIYSITFTDEATARRAVEVIRPKPISIFIPSAPALMSQRHMPASEDVERYDHEYYDEDDVDDEDL